MKKRPATTQRLETGVRNLDAIFHGGLPKGSVTVVCGPPGSGKTTLAQQLCFHNATPARRALYFNTLSEPTAKSIRYIAQFKFFDAKKLEEAIEFVDLGVILRTRSLAEASALIMEQVKRIKPAIVVIDSFKVFDDLAASPEELRKFGYEIAVNLMAWETTALLLGEYGPEDYQTNPLFSIVDGMLLITQREASGEQQRFLQLRKMRGTDHSADEYPFVINESGLEVYAPRVTLQRSSPEEHRAPRLAVGIQKLDELLGAGIPLGSSLLVGGVAGTGKTLLLLEFIYRGALAGEKGIMFSFEETKDRLRATALGMGWDLERELARGMVAIEFIPQPDIMVEKHLLMMQERVTAMGARRVAIDSVSVFMHKIKDPQVAREKMFQLATIIHNAGAVGFLATDIPYGTTQISRFGVEETVVDGVLLLTSTQEGAERRRYLEVYKLRNTAHLLGRHNLSIAHGGLQVFPRYNASGIEEDAPLPVKHTRRLSIGVPRLDELLGGGLLQRSVTLVSGSAGTGKTTLGVQFLLEGAKRRQHGVYVTLEEGPDQILESAGALGLPLREAVEAGLVSIHYLSRASVRAGQFASLLTDAVQTNKARRLVLDSVSHFITYGVDDDELRQLLYALVRRLKALDVTSLLTLESKALFTADHITDRDLSPTSDNLILLRYDNEPERLDPSLTVIKTRGSAHDTGVYRYGFGEGGIQVGTGRRELGAAPAAKGGPRKLRSRAKGP